MATIKEIYSLYQSCPRISKDTRESVRDTIYVSLRGENFNGNKFAEEALEKGARYAIVDDPSVIRNMHDARLIHVEDSLVALQQLANLHRKTLGCPILGITGSNGKTTTKELVARVLQKKFRLHYTQGNYNNQIGIPLTLLQLRDSIEFVVLEMGASAQQEIASYCKVAQPDYGIITNVGRAHLEGFGGVEGVRKGKGELYDYLAVHQGMAFVNSEEEHLDRMAVKRKLERKYIYHCGDRPVTRKGETIIHALRTDPSLALRFSDVTGKVFLLESPLMGRHNLMNVMTAIAVGNFFHINGARIQHAIQSYRPSNNRSQIFQLDGVTYVMDAYNANPDSMMAMIRSFAEWPDHQKVLVLGDMLELGQESQDAHQNVMSLIDQLPLFQEVYLVGPQFSSVISQRQVHYYHSIQELKSEWRHSDHVGQTVLLKASRSMKLEELIQ